MSDIPSTENFGINMGEKESSRQMKLMSDAIKRCDIESIKKQISEGASLHEEKYPFFLGWAYY